MRDAESRRPTLTWRPRPGSAPRLGSGSCPQRRPARLALFSPWLGFVLVFIALCFAPAELRAEEANGGAAEARQRFDRGVELYQEGDFAAALAEFLRAYEVSPNYAVLYNIAQTRAQLRRYPEAVATFERYLAEGGDRIPPSRRAAVQAEIARLRQLVGAIELEAAPGQQGVVYVDDIEVGRLPLESPLSVSAGQHVVEVRAPGFQTFRRAVTVAGSTRVVLSVDMIPEAAAPGTILITVPVPDATVTIDGREVGTTPLREAIPAAPGPHVVAATRPGYRSATAGVQVRSGEVAQVRLDLQRLDDLAPTQVGELQVEVSEDDAELRVDGAPLRDPHLPAGPHLLEVELPGFETHRELVQVNAGATTRVDVRLRPTPEYLARYRHRARAWRGGAWAATALAVALIGTTTGLFIWNHGRDEDRAARKAYLDEQWTLLVSGEAELTEAEINEGYDENRRLNDELRVWSGVEWAMLGLGVASLGVGIYLFLAGPRVGRYSWVEVTPSPTGLVLSGTF